MAPAVLRMSRPATAARLVEHHAATGTPHAQIAKLVGVSLNTLKKHYPEELELGLARANAVVSGTLFAEAKKGNITACIFWLKTRGSAGARPPRSSTAAAPRSRCGRSMRPSSRTRPSTS